MKILYFSIIAGLVICGTLYPAWATVDFNAFLPMEGTPITPDFKFAKNIAIDYSNGGKLKDALMGKNITIQFSDSSSNNTSIKSLMKSINTEFKVDRKSNATISKLRLDYQIQINGYAKYATFHYIVKLVPTINEYVISKGGSNGTVLDTSWIGFDIKDPVMIITKQYGDLEINSPIGVIKNNLPNVYNSLKGTQAETAMNLKILNASILLDQPIDKWDALFDPSAILADSAGVGYAGQNAAVTEFSYHGSIRPLNTEMEFTSDSKYHLTVAERPSSGIIIVVGHATGHMVQNYPVIYTTSAKSSTSHFGLNFQLESILVFLIISAVIAIFVFFRNRQGIKKIALFVWVPIILTYLYALTNPRGGEYGREEVILLPGIGFYFLSGVCYLFYRVFSKGWKKEKVAFVIIMLFCIGLFVSGLQLFEMATRFLGNGGISGVGLIPFAIALSLITIAIALCIITITKAKK